MAGGSPSSGLLSPRPRCQGPRAATDSTPWPFNLTFVACPSLPAPRCLPPRFHQLVHPYTYLIPRLAHSYTLHVWQLLFVLGQADPLLAEGKKLRDRFAAGSHFTIEHPEAHKLPGRAVVRESSLGIRIINFLTMGEPAELIKGSAAFYRQ